MMNEIPDEIREDVKLIINKFITQTGELDNDRFNFMTRNVSQPEQQRRQIKLQKQRIEGFIMNLNELNLSENANQDRQMYLDSLYKIRNKFESMQNTRPRYSFARGVSYKKRTNRRRNKRNMRSKSKRR
jgi:hypothetical protein